MRKKSFAEGGYYHIYNRGVEKRDIFLDDHDRWRFLTLLLVLQGNMHFPQVGRLVSLVKHLVFDKSVDSRIDEQDMFKDVLSNRMVELVCFCLMPNHFHLVLYETKEGGISKFMQRLGDGYTKYERSGHLFGGVFQSVPIDKNEYLNYLLAYVHLNPHTLKAWHRKEDQYPWSSYYDYVKTNRWGNFLNPSVVLEQFSVSEYKQFVKGSRNNIDIEDIYLIDNVSNT